MKGVIFFIWRLFKGYLGQNYRNIYVRFLVQMKTQKNPFEINWPLGMYFDTAVTFFKNFSLLFRWALAILWLGILIHLIQFNSIWYFFTYRKQCQ